MALAHNQIANKERRAEKTAMHRKERQRLKEVESKEQTKAKVTQNGKSMQRWNKRKNFQK